MPKRPLQPSRLFALAFASAAPGLAVIAVLVFAGRLEPLTGIAAGACILLGSAVLARPFLRGLLAMRAYAEALVSGRGAEPPATASLLMPELVSAVRRAHEVMQRHRGDAERDRALQARVLDALPDAVLIADADNRILFANRAAGDLLGSRIGGQEIGSVVRNPALRRGLESLSASGGEAAHIEFTIPVPAERVLMASLFPVGQAPVAGQRPGGGRGEAAAAVVLHDITERKRIETLRRDFIANLGHEMRTPLTNIIGFIDTLQGPAAEDSAARGRFLEVMDRQAGRMTRLLKGLTSLNAIELQEHTLPSERVDLVAMIRSVVDEFEPQAKAAQAEISLTFDESMSGGAFVRADPDQMAEVISNLFDNAIKYGGDGVSIRVQATAGGVPGTYRVCVIDDGPGIPEHHVPRLTERFYRVDPARSPDIGGTGLGLAIVKHILTRHRGRLTVESEPGSGSTFCFELPALQSAPGSPTKNSPEET